MVAGIRACRGRWLLAGSLLLGTIPAGASPAQAQPAEERSSRSVAAAPVPEGRARLPEVADRYIVRLREATSADRIRALARVATRSGARVHFVYTAALQGFAATLTPTALARLRSERAVQAIEPDAALTTDGPMPGRGQGPGARATVPFGLDRIDARTLPTDGVYDYRATGAGVRAYVVDTGIRSSHREFAGRVERGFDAVADGLDAEDCNGHGTHVAGTIGGATYGVAKQVRLVPVRVLDCAGAGLVSEALAGVEYVTADHLARPRTPAVANMSMGVARIPMLNRAVAASIATGVSYVAAAGNDNIAACRRSPGSVRSAITVAATDRWDVRTWFSNHGRCVDLFAPGIDVASAWIFADKAGLGCVGGDRLPPRRPGSDSGSCVLSGTSMAAPHVSGVVAMYLQGHPGAAPARVAAAVTAWATAGVVREAAGAPNRLLYSALPVSSIRCFGAVPTILGTMGADRIRGTPGPDVILGFGGADRIDGRGGADRICGGGGGDLLVGGAGADRLDGGAGADHLHGRPGSDRCRGGPGADVVLRCG